MGSAFTAVHDDPASIAYNPASLGQLRAVSLGASFLRQFHIPAGEVDQDETTLVLGVPVEQELIKGGIGLSWSFLDQLDYSNDRTMRVGYGSRGFVAFENGSLELGGAFKLMTRNFASGGRAVNKATLDVGVLSRLGEKFAVGLSLLNFSGPNFEGRTLDRVPVTLKLGVSETLGRFMIAADLTKRESSGFHSGSTSLAAGLENWWATPRAGSWAVRTGLSLGDQDKAWTWGLGWRILGAQIDYAMSVPLAGITRASHGFSLFWRFGQSDPEAQYEKLLRDELRMRRDMTRALEASEVRQWKLEEELKRLQKEIDALRARLTDKAASESEAKQKVREAERRVQEIERRRQEAVRSSESIRQEIKRITEKTKAELFREDWAAYERLKSGGAPDSVCLDEVKRLLRQYKDSGVDLSEANQELRRLLQGR